MAKRKNATDLKKMFQDFDKMAIEEQRRNMAERKKAVGILSPAQLEKRMTRGKSLVLAYGRSGKTVTYSPEDLRQFLQYVKKRASQYNDKTSGITISQILRNSLAIDKERAKTVKNAILYQHKGNILFFRVTGNSKPYYQVMIRLDSLNFADPTPALQVARNALNGLVSIECPCGRHQYWYRYLATLGNYAITPLEHGFPKIRNKTLKGCCCKHVLKVLQVLKGNIGLVLLTNIISKEQGKANPGYSGTRKTILDASNLKLAQGQRLNRAGANALKKYKQDIENFNKQTKPSKINTRGGISKDQAKTILPILKSLIPSVQAGILSKSAVNKALTNLAKNSGLTLAQIKEFAQSKKIDLGV